ncbi:hypothetical protein WEI85_05995 [Actinomycetes bacterium KLBMP 9797]
MRASTPGSILAQRGGVPLEDDVTPKRLRARLAPLIRDLVTAALQKVSTGVPGRPQPDAHAPVPG